MIEINKDNIEKINFLGKKVTDMNKDELMDVVIWCTNYISTLEKEKRKIDNERIDLLFGRRK